VAKLGAVSKIAETGIFKAAEKFFRSSMRVAKELPGEPKRLLNRFARGAENDLSSAERKRLFALATKARDDGLAGMSRKEARKYATATGGVNMKTGETAFGLSSNPTGCAEDDVVRRLGGNPDDILFSIAKRPRTGDAIDICRRCQTKFRRSQFPIGTLFQRAWR
jgi:hypothetical protein